MFYSHLFLSVRIYLLAFPPYVFFVNSVSEFTSGSMALAGEEFANMKCQVKACLSHLSREFRSTCSNKMRRLNVVHAALIYSTLFSVYNMCIFHFFSFFGHCILCTGTDTENSSSTFVREFSQQQNTLNLVRSLTEHHNNYSDDYTFY